MVDDFSKWKSEIWYAKNELIETINNRFEEYIVEYNKSVIDLPSQDQ